MKTKDAAMTAVSETRFAHFVRSAPASERQRVFVRAIKEASADQRKVIDAHKATYHNAHCPA